MRLVFAGTPDFARQALAALIAADHEIVLAMAQPDRPAGRGLRVQDGPVKALAVERGIPVLQPRGLRLGGKYDDDARAAQARLQETPHDAMIVAAYGLILPQPVLDIAPRGCINIHASLLPRWRGAAPVQRAIEAGDRETGITIMRMDAGLDTGPMLLVRPIPIEAGDTGGSLTAKLATLGGTAIVDALAALERGELSARPQDDACATYANKITKAESALDFSATSRVLVDRIRAFDPWPGCTARVTVEGRDPVVFKVWSATVGDVPSGPGPVGEVLRAGDPAAIHVRTADGSIAIHALQKPGGKRLAAAAFVNEFAASTAVRFDPPA